MNFRIFFFASLVLAATPQVQADEHKTYLSPEGVQYAVPTDGWEAVTLRQIIEITDNHKKLDQSLRSVPNAKKVLAQHQRIYLLNMMIPEGRVAQVSLGLNQMTPAEQLSLKQIKSSTKLRRDLDQLVSERLGPDIARALHATPGYASAVLVDGRLRSFGEWECMFMEFDLSMDTGHRLDHWSVQCPDGEKVVQFTIYIDHSYRSVAQETIEQMIASVDTSQAAWSGAQP